MYQTESVEQLHLDTLCPYQRSYRRDRIHVSMLILFPQMTTPYSTVLPISVQSLVQLDFFKVFDITVTTQLRNSSLPSSSPTPASRDRQTERTCRASAWAQKAKECSVRLAAATEPKPKSKPCLSPSIDRRVGVGPTLRPKCAILNPVMLSKVPLCCTRESLAYLLRRPGLRTCKNESFLTVG